jgi:uncharacterized protein (DUF885 family)
MPTFLSRQARKALEDYANFLRGLRRFGTFAVGEKTYSSLVQVRHRLNLDARALREFGRREFDATLAEMRELGGDIERIKRQHPSSAELRGVYERETERARRFVVDRDLAALPDGRLEIIDTPEFMRSSMPYAAYSRPTPLGRARVGHFYVTPADTERKLRGHNYADIENTVLHEAYPGHHLQLMYANSIPSKIRRQSESPTLC